MGRICIEIDTSAVAASIGAACSIAGASSRNAMLSGATSRARRAVAPACVIGLLMTRDAVTAPRAGFGAARRRRQGALTRAVTDEPRTAVTTSARPRSGLRAWRWRAFVFLALALTAVATATFLFAAYRFLALV